MKLLIIVLERMSSPKSQLKNFKIEINYTKVFNPLNYSPMIDDVKTYL